MLVSNERYSFQNVRCNKMCVWETSVFFLLLRALSLYLSLAVYACLLSNSIQIDFYSWIGYRTDLDELFFLPILALALNPSKIEWMNKRDGF